MFEIDYRSRTQCTQYKWCEKLDVKTLTLDYEVVALRAQNLQCGYKLYLSHMEETFTIYAYERAVQLGCTALDDI